MDKLGIDFNRNKMALLLGKLNKMKPQKLKNQIRRYATIKIDLEREVEKIGKYSVAFKDRIYYVDIKIGNTTISFGAKTLKEAFKNIKEEMFL